MLDVTQIIFFWKPALFAFVLGVISVKLALRFFPALGLMDRPQKYGLKRAPIPYYGGTAIFVAFMISVLVFLDLSPTLLGLLLGASMIALIGFLDDYFDVSPFVRICFQILAALVLVFFGIGILSINLPFVGMLDFSEPKWVIEFLDTRYTLMVFSALFTVIWMVAIVNAMNFIDGISGLSSGVGFVAALIIFLLSIHPILHENPASQTDLATVSIILSMVCLAFLLFDFPKPRILMGDTGSTFLGFLLATLAIYSGGKVATAFLVLGLPILDTIWAVLRRVYSGKKFWQGDLKHLHHRLLDLGASERLVVLFYLFVTSLFGFFAVFFVSTQQKLFVVVALLVLMLMLVLSLTMMPKKK